MTEGVCTRATREMLKYLREIRDEDKRLKEVIDRAIDDPESNWLAALHQPCVLELLMTYVEADK